MIQTASEIKAQILKESINQPVPQLSQEKASHFIEVGTAVKRMTGTKGWKIVEAWLMRQLDVGKILEAKPEQLPLVHAKAQAYAEVVKQIQYWINLGEQLENELNKETKE
jgi:hypothetical protein